MPDSVCACRSMRYNPARIARVRAASAETRRGSFDFNEAGRPEPFATSKEGDVAIPRAVLADRQVEDQMLRRSYGAKVIFCCRSPGPGGADGRTGCCPGCQGGVAGGVQGDG